MFSKTLHTFRFLKRIILSTPISLVFRGDCGPPSIRSTVAVQLVLLPYRILRYCWWVLRWILLFTILQRPYGSEEKEFLTRYRLGYSQKVWNSFDAEKRDQFIRLELWDREKFKVCMFFVSYLFRISRLTFVYFQAYLDRRAEEMRIRIAEATSQKRYRRYVKNHGPPVANLDDS